MAGEVPGIENKFRIPRDNNDQTLLNAARAPLTDATPLKTQFIAHEMPAAFWETWLLTSTRWKPRWANRRVASAIISRQEPRSTMRLRAGMDLLRKLDAIVRNKYANNPAVLAEWTSASHVERAPKRAKAAPPAPVGNENPQG